MTKQHTVKAPQWFIEEFESVHSIMREANMEAAKATLADPTEGTAKLVQAKQYLVHEVLKTKRDAAWAKWMWENQDLLIEDIVASSSSGVPMKTKLNLNEELKEITVTFMPGQQEGVSAQV